MSASDSDDDVQVIEVKRGVATKRKPDPEPIDTRPMKKEVIVLSSDSDNDDEEVKSMLDSAVMLLRSPPPTLFLTPPLSPASTIPDVSSPPPPSPPLDLDKDKEEDVDSEATLTDVDEDEEVEGPRDSPSSSPVQMMMTGEEAKEAQDIAAVNAALFNFRINGRLQKRAKIDQWSENVVKRFQDKYTNSQGKTIKPSTLRIFAWQKGRQIQLPPLEYVMPDPKYLMYYRSARYGPGKSTKVKSIDPEVDCYYTDPECKKPTTALHRESMDLQQIRDRLDAIQLRDKQLDRDLIALEKIPEGTLGLITKYKKADQEQHALMTEHDALIAYLQPLEGDETESEVKASVPLFQDEEEQKFTASMSQEVMDESDLHKGPCPDGCPDSPCEHRSSNSGTVYDALVARLTSEPLDDVVFNQAEFDRVTAELEAKKQFAETEGIGKAVCKLFQQRATEYEEQQAAKPVKPQSATSFAIPRKPIHPYRN